MIFLKIIKDIYMCIYPTVKVIKMCFYTNSLSLNCV